MLDSALLNVSLLDNKSLICINLIISNNIDILLLTET